ncbi:hypothetical protein [Gallibacterium sp. AGMB14963]|uniref:hypothetical protein n=1 Tax=Gallibacterium faecale TaxID=3019086 RepID=UPI0022F1D646|nr:hypothetical protein [Gallibacterium sp. AGMB14963]MDA3977933.1 hypothetical protein [Gallibacterium sp. AGMB14963]
MTLADVFPHSSIKPNIQIPFSAEIRVISQNMQREPDGTISFATTYSIQNQSKKSIQQVAWYAVYTFNDRIIDNRFINLKFNQFNILKPQQRYYLSTLLPEEEMITFSKNIFTNNTKNIRIKPIIKFIQFDDCEEPHKMRNKINRELVGKNWNKRVKKLGMTRLDVISSLFCR